MPDRVSCQVTTTIKARDAALIPSKMCPAVDEERSFDSRGAVQATKKNAGKKMPNVATSAPLGNSEGRLREAAPGEAEGSAAFASFTRTDIPKAAKHFEILLAHLTLGGKAPVRSFEPRADLLPVFLQVGKLCLSEH